MTLRDLALARYWFIGKREMFEDSPDDGEASTDTIENNKHKCSETKHISLLAVFTTRVLHLACLGSK